jgi:hypothetical protein
MIAFSIGLIRSFNGRVSGSVSKSACENYGISGAEVLAKVTELADY